MNGHYLLSKYKYNEDQEVNTDGISTAVSPSSLNALLHLLLVAARFHAAATVVADEAAGAADDAGADSPNVPTARF